MAVPEQNRKWLRPSIKRPCVDRICRGAGSRYLWLTGSPIPSPRPSIKDVLVVSRDRLTLNHQHMKTRLHSSLLKTVLLLVSLALSIGSLPTSQAGTSNAFFVGAAHIGAPHHRQGSAQGYLLVYSATDPFDDGGLVFNAHSSYSVYTPDGKLFKNVENHISRSDEIPELVSLPVGSYIVGARSENNGYVRLRVVIKPGQRTILALDE
jgi:hypothetical protein